MQKVVPGVFIVLKKFQDVGNMWFQDTRRACKEFRLVSPVKRGQVQTTLDYSWVQINPNLVSEGLNTTPQGPTGSANQPRWNC